MAKKSGKSEFSPLNLKLEGKIFSYGYWADGNLKVWRPGPQYMEKACADREDKDNKQRIKKVRQWREDWKRCQLMDGSPFPAIPTASLTPASPSNMIQ